MAGAHGRTRDRLRRMLRKFFASEAGGKAKGLLSLLLALLLLINGLNVVNSYVGRDFMTALEQRASETFLRQAVLYVGVFALSTLVLVLLRFTEETLALTWREWMARWALRRYLEPAVYQRLLANGELANPDQRIAEDVKTFTTTSLSLLLLLLNGSITILGFSGVLWSISPRLLLVGVVYAAAGSLLAVAFGRRLVKLNVAQLDREAEFRAELIHVRENAEALAIAQREDRLLRRLLRRVDELVANFRRIIAVNRNLGFFTTGYNYLIQIIPALVVARLFISGAVEFGVVTQSAMAFTHLIGAFSLLITQFQSVSSYAAVVTRLGALDEALQLAKGPPQIDLSTDGGLVYEGLTLRSPGDGRVLLRELTGSVAPGARVLILGPNEDAQSALFRATAGTWDVGSGRIVRPERRLFLAEQPYLPAGSLRDALTSVDQEISTERLLDTLRLVGLDESARRIGGLDAEQRWDQVLSLAEQKRVALARALLSAPRLLFLERPATGLDPEDVLRILGLLPPSCSVLAIGRPEDAGPFYRETLELENDGTWRWNRHSA